MSTSCLFPLGLFESFRLAKLADFDGVEIMVTADRATRDADHLLELSRRFDLPILSIHAPVLALTQFVWGLDPRKKLERSAELAVATGASTVVAHPPFRWQGSYAREFESIVRQTGSRFGIEIAVENMFTWQLAGANRTAYAPSEDPTRLDVEAMTLDFSHAALAGHDSLELAHAMGDRLRHVHLCDGSAVTERRPKFDEHQIPGRGGQHVAEVLGLLTERGWAGSLIAEVHTSGPTARRLSMLRETIAFAREHARQPARV